MIYTFCLIENFGNTNKKDEKNKSDRAEMDGKPTTSDDTSSKGNTVYIRYCYVSAFSKS